MTNAETPTSWFYILHIHSQKRTNSRLPSRLEFAFLLDNVSSLSVLSIPTHTMITRVFNVFNQDQHDKSKTSTLANDLFLICRNEIQFLKTSSRCS